MDKKHRCQKGTYSRRLVHDLLAIPNILGIKLGLVHAILEAYFFSYGISSVFLIMARLGRTAGKSQR